MELKIDKDWFTKKAAAEDDLEISCGSSRSLSEMDAWALTHADGSVADFTDSPSIAQAWVELGYVVRCYKQLPIELVKKD